MPIYPTVGFRRSVHGLSDQVESAIREMIQEAIPPQDRAVIGEIKFVTTQPDKIEPPFLYCDGRIVVRSKYPLLFDKIGFQFAEDGDDTSETAIYFRLPNLVGKIPKGVPTGTAMDVYAGQTVTQAFDTTAVGTLTFFYLTSIIRAL